MIYRFSIDIAIVTSQDSILIVIFILIVFVHCAVYTGRDKVTVANPLNFVSVRHQKNEGFTCVDLPYH